MYVDGGASCATKQVDIEGGAAFRSLSNRTGIHSQQVQKRNQSARTAPDHDSNLKRDFMRFYVGLGRGAHKASVLLEGVNRAYSSASST